MKPVILVTGATGFTGCHACAHFARSGMKVVATSRQSSESGRTNDQMIHGDSTDSKHIPADVVPDKMQITAGSADKVSWDEMITCDMTDREQVQQLVNRTKPDYVLHLAGINDVRSSWQDPVHVIDVNVRGTVHLLDALATLPEYPKILVTGSALGFDPAEDPPRPSHPYSLSKTLQSLITRAWFHMYSLPAMVAEPTNLIGPGHSAGLCGLLADYIARWEKGLVKEPFRFSSLTEKRNFLDVRDAVSAYEKILLHGTPGERYRFGSRKLRSIGDVLAGFTAATGQPFPYVNMESRYRDPDPLLPPAEPMSTLGWKPRIPFSQSIRDILRDARARYRSRPQNDEGGGAR